MSRTYDEGFTPDEYREFRGGWAGFTNENETQPLPTWASHQVAEAIGDLQDHQGGFVIPAADFNDPEWLGPPIVEGK